MISMTWPQYLRRECTLHGPQTVKLSQQETEALFCLLVRRPEPINATAILEVLYPEPDREPEYAWDNTKRVMMNLRNKLGKGRIVHHRSYGYRVP